MGILGRLTIVSGVVVGIGCYYGFEHWRKISIYPKETRTHLRTALRAAKEGRSGEAEKYYHKALDSCNEGTGQDSDASKSILIKMAEFYSERGRFDRAVGIYEALSKGKLQDSRRIEIQKALGDAYIEGSGLDLERGTVILMDALSHAKRLNSSPSITGPIYESLAEASFKIGDYVKSVEYYKESLKDCNSVLGRDNWNCILLLNNIASCLLATHEDSNIKGACVLAKEGLDLLKNTKPDDLTILKEVEDNFQKIILKREEKE